MNLTKEQIIFITWLSQGNFVAVCTEVGPALGNVMGTEPYSGTFNIRTLHKLIREGLVKKTSKHFYGLRWDSFSVNRKGKEVIKNA